ncbi:MAG: hypothetical protein ABL872_16665 [Lacibacter sp.]
MPVKIPINHSYNNRIVLQCHFPDMLAIKRKLLPSYIFIIFLLISQFANAQDSTTGEFRNERIKIDSIIANKNLNNLIEHEFVGAVDSIIGGVKGKVFLKIGEKEIKYVRFYTENKRLKYEYYLHNNELILVVEPKRIFFLEKDKFYEFNLAEQSKTIVKTELISHQQFINTIIRMYSLK